MLCFVRKFAVSCAKFFFSKQLGDRQLKSSRNFFKQIQLHTYIHAYIYKIVVEAGLV